ncbi:uncharacterized protein G2W53_036508 [Senna tora]|uniref:Uncharacterized protein n=1 Tax=Senna tora TaxID=362788 RepID=A0A834W4V5_9FABA|nr:uncharacterized protein G2W53_036508 [Senna tora]
MVKEADENLIVSLKFHDIYERAPHAIGVGPTSDWPMGKRDAGLMQIQNLWATNQLAW